MAFNPTEHLTDLSGGKGQPRWYLEAKWRVAWFRDEHPDGVISTKIERLDETVAIVQAVVAISGGGSASGLGMCEKAQSARFQGRYVEKAETAAIARALAALGYGTQYTGLDFDDSEDLSDSPAEPPPVRRDPAKVYRDYRKQPAQQDGAMVPSTQAQQKLIHTLLSKLTKDEREQYEIVTDLQPATKMSETRFSTAALSKAEASSLIDKLTKWRGGTR